MGATPGRLTAVLVVAVVGIAFLAGATEPIEGTDPPKAWP
jgi:hypothetical protein